MKKLGLDLVNLYLLRNINLAQKFELFYTTTMWIISFSDSVEPILISHLMDIVVHLHTLKICVCGFLSKYACAVVHKYEFMLLNRVLFFPSKRPFIITVYQYIKIVFTTAFERWNHFDTYLNVCCYSLAILDWILM